MSTSMHPGGTTPSPARPLSTGTRQGRDRCVDAPTDR